MDKLYFSENNIANQTKKLILNLELPEDQINREVVLKCKKIITNHMKETFEKYGSAKPTGANPNEFVDKLNKKSLSDCIRVFSEKQESPTNKSILCFVVSEFIRLNKSSISFLDKGTG